MNPQIQAEAMTDQSAPHRPQATVAEMNPDLSVNRLEVTASPMLGLVEVRSRAPIGSGLGKVGHRYYQGAEARRLSGQLAAAALELEEEEAALESRRPPEAPLIAASVGGDRSSAVDGLYVSHRRYVVAREVAGGWRIFDHLTGCVLAADYPEPRREEAERFAEQLNDSAAAEVKKATRAEA